MEPQPRFLLTGASGLLGSEITRLLDAENIPWNALRHGEPGWDAEAGQFDPSHLEGITGVIHLAGENIASGRWTEDRKQNIRDSRVEGTRAIAEAMAMAETKPDFFICASATGFYGDRGDELLDESSAPGEGFLPEVVSGWEKAADPAREAGIRVVHLRLGIVLSPDGGALKKMLPPFRMGLGGPLGDGRMWMSWVHLSDAASAFVRSARDQKMKGVYNLVAPESVQNETFTRCLSDAIHRPAFFRVPSAIIRLLFGEMGTTLLLSSTRVMPERLLKEGFVFQYPKVDSALNHLLGSEAKT
jgi:uncharacterized protein (TIGR01777 family)